MVKCYTSRPSEMVFNVWRALRDPYCSQMLPFLSGRLGVMRCSSVAGWEYHTECIHQERIICPEITHQGPQTWFSMFNVPCLPIQLPFLSGRLGVMGVPHWPVGSLPYKIDIGIELYGQILHIQALRDGFQCFACFTCPTLLSNAAVPQWPVGSNEVFLSGRLGVFPIRQTSG